MEGPPPKKRTEFIPGRPEGASARRVIDDTIHTQAYEVQLPEGESIPVYSSDLAKEGIPWKGAETVTPDDPVYQRILEVAYRKKERMSSPEPEEADETEVIADAPARTWEKSTNFIPGREPGAVAERLIGGEHGVFDISEQRYQVRLPSGEIVEIGPNDLAAEGILTEGATTIQPSDREYPNLIEAAYRKREGTTRKQEQEALRDAIRSYALTVRGETLSGPAKAPEEPEEALEAEVVEAHERWEHREGVRNGNGRANGERREAPDAETVGQGPPQSPPHEPPRGPEQPRGPESHGERHEKQSHKDHKHEHDQAHGGHDHKHDHAHGLELHLPRNLYEWEEAGVAVALGCWYVFIKLPWMLHQFFVDAFSYILTGDTRHPWQTLWKNISGEFKKGLGLKGGGGGGHGGGGGGGHGGGHH